MDAYNTIATLAALEVVLTQLGFDVELGKGVAKAQEILVREGEQVCLSKS